jgi:PhoD related phosphatase
MPNVISSAIVNTPPADMMADILNKRNKIHHLNHETDESMIPIFTKDVDGSKRNNKHLMPKRNWCSIRECTPDLTPSPTPSDERSLSPVFQEHSRRGILRRFSARGPSYRADAGPPVSMGMRNFSLTRGRASTDSERPKTRRSLSLSRKDFIPANLFRRGSKRRPDDGGINGYGAESDEDESPDQQIDPPKLRGGGYGEESFVPTRDDPPRRKRIGRNTLRGSDNENANYDEDQQQNRLPHQPPPQHYGSQTQHQLQVEQEHEQEPMRKPFHRVPTSLSEHGRRFGGPQYEINLEGGLDICLNVEVNPKDPAGITVPYRLLVPALWYGGKERSSHHESHEWKEPSLARLISFRRGKGPSNASWKGKERENASTEEYRDV